jgi:hypothetical protein
VILGVYPIYRHTQSVLVEFHVTSFWCLLWVAILAMQTSTFFSRFAAWKIGDWATSRVVTHAMHLAYLSVNGMIKDFESPTQWPLQLEISDFIFGNYIYIYIFIYIFIKLYIYVYMYIHTLGSEWFCMIWRRITIQSKRTVVKLLEFL